MLCSRLLLASVSLNVRRRLCRLIIIRVSLLLCVLSDAYCVVTAGSTCELIVLRCIACLCVALCCAMLC